MTRPAPACSYPARHRPTPHEVDMHHVVPRSWGGPDAPANKVPLCAGCHHNVHWLIDEYVREGAVPPASVLRHYTALERDLAARAWAGRPARPTFTTTAPKEAAVTTGDKQQDIHIRAAAARQPAPGPGARAARTAGQVGGTVVLVDLVQAFGWLGSAHWTAAQSAQRWPALTAAIALGVSVLHNLAGWVRQLPPAGP